MSKPFEKVFADQELERIERAGFLRPCGGGDHMKQTLKLVRAKHTGAKAVYSVGEIGQGEWTVYLPRAKERILADWRNEVIEYKRRIEAIEKAMNKVSGRKMRHLCLLCGETLISQYGNYKSMTNQMRSHRKKHHGSHKGSMKYTVVN